MGRRRASSGDDYAVGYGNPPEASRFKTGQSGNPKGRPRNAHAREGAGPIASDVTDLILAEGRRLVGTGNASDLSAVQANIRALAERGAQGDRVASRNFIELVRGAEEVRLKLAVEIYEKAYAYKMEASAELAECRRLGLEPPEMLPHPDDIFLEPMLAGVDIRGPSTRAEKERWDQLLERLDGHVKQVVEFEADAAKETDADMAAFLREEAAQSRALVDKVNGWLPERYRRDLPPEVPEADPPNSPPPDGSGDGPPPQMSADGSGGAWTSA